MLNLVFPYSIFLTLSIFTDNSGNATEVTHYFLFHFGHNLAARLMHKYNAHGATDVTGFGLLGHAANLAKVQKNEVGFVIHNLPIVAKMAAISKACGNLFGLLQGTSAETSGE